MTEKINKLEAIFNDALKTALTGITPEKIDEILDNRDSAAFSDAWMKAYHTVEEKVANEEVEDRISDIRKEIFVSVFKTTGSSDLPAYISDDFGLICSYSVHQIENNWVTNLLFTYLHHQIPQGELMKTDKTLEELIQ
ncbi:Uncharacterised protein [Chryseobacterium gleum]|uniref:Uncharacterized protein n=2 Tax=Chryseobacterium gleum TaxID=250 RepID=A0A448B2S9_CHRGE|nr:hypothetical protein [Chryseobacterium gleum]EFK33006.1 hypothetical protein HMPREF0204_12074 [Chryseobacterium gleum ATCC 35910]QQY33836.1 hypothetical protein I6I60_08765 [Chryseobacterium gleum]VEE07897.1 Uncharacterised protein [Chryseobacterium gleum]